MSSTALAIIEQSPIAKELGAQSRALLSLLPDEAAVRRFQRVTLQALAKNPDLLECTPDSVITSVMEAASMGLEPTGGIGGAHLVPFNVNVGTKDNPRWQKRAQLIPDFRGVVRMIVRPRADGTPSEVTKIEARAVKEGDEFAWTEGTDPTVTHVPALSADRSAKPTTHVYAVATLRSGETQIDVMDHAAAERIRQRGKKKASSPWDTDWDEMAKKSVVKRLGKLLPVEPEVRAILAREDEPEAVPEPAPAALPRGSRTAALAARLAPAEPAQDAPQDAEYREVAPTSAPEPTTATCGDVAADGLMAGAICILDASHTGAAHKSADGSWPR